MLIHLPEDVKAILHTLQEAGYEAYAVGGCIRDSLLGRRPDDWISPPRQNPRRRRLCLERRSIRESSTVR